MKKVLLATRPLVPPWDEASKNFAYFLGKEVKNHYLTLLTTQKNLDGLPLEVRQEPIFRSAHFNLKTKMELFWYLRQARAHFDITHYLFTPTKLNTTLIKLFAKPIKGKTIQTIATLRDDLYSQEELKKLFFADQLIVYTDATKQKLEKLDFTNVTRIYPGIDLDKFCPQPKNIQLLKQWKLDERHFIVSYVGEYTRLGATNMITGAFVDFFKKNPKTNLRLVFACRIKNQADKRKKKEVQMRFFYSGFLDYVIFTDSITDMSSLYNSSDIIIFPVKNLKGKFDVPLVIIESYACGKPVILSDLEQFGEFANRDICVSIPKDSEIKLIESVTYLKENEAERVRLGENARRFVKNHFDLQNTAKQYEKIYAKI